MSPDYWPISLGQIYVLTKHIDVRITFERYLKPSTQTSKFFVNVKNPQPKPRQKSMHLYPKYDTVKTAKLTFFFTIVKLFTKLTGWAYSLSLLSIRVTLANHRHLRAHICELKLPLDCITLPVTQQFEKKFCSGRGNTFHTSTFSTGSSHMIGTEQAIEEELDKLEPL